MADVQVQWRSGWFKKVALEASDLIEEEAQGVADRANASMPATPGATNPNFAAGLDIDAESGTPRASVALTVRHRIRRRKFPIRMHFHFELARFPSTHAENPRPDSGRNLDNSSTRYFTNSENFCRQNAHAIAENVPTCHSRLAVVCLTAMRYNVAC